MQSCEFKILLSQRTLKGNKLRITRIVKYIDVNFKLMKQLNCNIFTVGKEQLGSGSIWNIICNDIDARWILSCLNRGKLTCATNERDLDTGKLTCVCRIYIELKQNGNKEE